MAGWWLALDAWLIYTAKTKAKKPIGTKPLVLTEWVLKLVTCSRFLSKPSQVGWSAFACDGIVPYEWFWFSFVHHRA